MVAATVLAAAAVAGWAGEALSPREAASRAGEEVLVRGHVDRVVCSSAACLLSFEPGFRGLVVAIPADLRGAIPSPREAFEGRTVEVRGTVEERSGRPRLVLRDAAEIRRLPLEVGVIESRTTERAGGLERSHRGPAGRLAPAPPPGGRSHLGEAVRALEREAGAGSPGTAAASARIEVLASRVDALERRLAETMPAAPGLLPLAGGLPPREPAEPAAGWRDALADLEARIDALGEDVGVLDERLAAIEQELAGRPEREADVPRLPDYVVPAYQPPSLNRVRRGWTAERVLRTLGAPERVVRAAGGGSVWDYGDGRSVTVDGRGRVVAVAGF